MNIFQFVELYPQFALDFTALVDRQQRVLDEQVLFALPVELEPVAPYRQGGRGRPNRNQTKTHVQCAKCHRVFRNDCYFFNNKRGEIHRVCKDCHRVNSANRYSLKSQRLKDAREAIWKYIAPRCAYCGFDAHVAAIDMHHVRDKENLFGDLVARLTQSSDAWLERNATMLIEEASKCIPLCANCHRLAHVGAIDTSSLHPQQYDLADFLRYFNQEIAKTPQLLYLEA